MKCRWSVHGCVACLFALVSFAQAAGEATHVFRGDAPMYTKILDEEFPFFEATIDLRGISPVGTDDNLVPRGMVIALDNDVFVCFDTELLRVAAIWQGDYATPNSIAMLSYAEPFNKLGPGHRKLPQPNGRGIAATGLYPGWQARKIVKLKDTRPRWLDDRELGRGPLPREHGRWLGVEDLGKSAEISYSLYGGTVKERFSVASVDGIPSVLRRVQLIDVSKKVSLIVTDYGDTGGRPFELETLDPLMKLSGGRAVVLEVPPSESAVSLALAYPLNGDVPRTVSTMDADFDDLSKGGMRWSVVAKTSFALGEPQGAYAVDELVLPYPNSWCRRIRPVAIDFLPTGDAFVLTFDGDVYRVSNLGEDGRTVEFRRIATGFNEPQSIRVRGEDVFVFSRLGISRLVDRDNDGEADFYEMFCNGFTQSADTRDFPLSLILQSDGSFLISKGGQQEDFQSPHSGRVLSVSPDGEKVNIYAEGLRNGYLATHPNVDLVTASDQQGDWVPSTPLHIVRQGDFLGFEPGASARRHSGTQEAALWLPHRFAQSGIGQLWCLDPRSGPLEETLLYIDYQRPALLKIIMPQEEPIVQAVAIPLLLDIETPLLKGAVNPVDGQPYFVGFQVWSSQAKRLEGICRLRVLESSDRFPTRAAVFKEGVMLGFDKPLDSEKAIDVSSYRAIGWNYLRTAAYGSAQYKSNGKPGVDNWPIHSALISPDRKSVFLAMESVRRTMQLEVQYKFGDKWDYAFFTINEFPSCSESGSIFASQDFKKLFASEPAPRVVPEKAHVESAERGLEIYTQYGCAGCHSIDGSSEGRTGPTWKGLYGRKRRVVGGAILNAYEEYLRDAIWEPSKDVPIGYDGEEAAMASYQGILTESDVNSVILYLQSIQ